MISAHVYPVTKSCQVLPAWAVVMGIAFACTLVGLAFWFVRQTRTDVSAIIEIRDRFGRVLALTVPNGNAAVIHAYLM